MMTTPGRLHLAATSLLLLVLVAVGAAQADTVRRPADGFGTIHTPQPGSGGFIPTGTSGTKI